MIQSIFVEKSIGNVIMSSLQDVLQLWQNDLNFRLEFKKNPEEALKKAQVELSHADLDKVKKMIKHADSDSGNEDLDERISK